MGGVDCLNVWGKIEMLNKNISVIVKCIDVSKKEIEEQLRNLDSSRRSTDEDFNTELLTTLLGGEVFSGLSNDEKRSISKKAFLTLDIMSSIVARIDEIISSKNSS